MIEGQGSKVSWEPKNRGWTRSYVCCWVQKKVVHVVGPTKIHHLKSFPKRTDIQKIASSSKWMGTVKIKHVGSIKVINPSAVVVYYCCFTNPSGETKLVGTCDNLKSAN